MSEKITVPKLRAMKQKGEKIVSVTAYDATFGALADAAGADVVLVGDSVGNVLLGYDSTLPVTLEQMVHHTRATRAGVRRALLLADLPFGTYQASPEQAVRSAVELIRAGAEAVKLEGPFDDAIAALTKAGIPTMGHLGMTPQSVHQFGGFRVQGRGDAGARVVDAAKALENAGAVAIVLELVPGGLAERITRELQIPTIGIGAGKACDGQVQVLHDLLGLVGGEYRHAKRYVEGAKLLGEALTAYVAEVRSGSFPTEDHTF
jgi:3-methyl-2-oxobutanoate hydroxymethyltransferase